MEEQINEMQAKQDLFEKQQKELHKKKVKAKKLKKAKRIEENEKKATYINKVVFEGD